MSQDIRNIEPDTLLAYQHRLENLTEKFLSFERVCGNIITDLEKSTRLMRTEEAVLVHAQIKAIEVAKKRLLSIARQYYFVSESIHQQLFEIGQVADRSTRFVNPKLGKLNIVKEPVDEKSRRMHEIFGKFSKIPLAPYWQGGTLLAKMFGIGNERGFATEVPVSDKRKPPKNSSLADICLRIGDLKPGQFELIPVLGKDKVMRFIVVMRGMELGSNTPNNQKGAIAESIYNSAALSDAVAHAMSKYKLSYQAEVMIVAHSQGGIAAMNLAQNSHLNGLAGKYNITHVVTLGSPVGNKRFAFTATTKGLHLENASDGIPELDGVEDRDSKNRAVYEFGNGAPIGAAAHDLRKGYLPELRRERFSKDPRVKEFQKSAGKYYEGESQPAKRYLARREDIVERWHRQARENLAQNHEGQKNS